MLMRENIRFFCVVRAYDKIEGGGEEMWKVLVTREIPSPGVELVREVAEVDLWEEDRAIPREVLLERIGDKDGLLCLLTDRVDREVLERGKKLRVVSNYAVGYDNVDVEEAKKREIIVTNTPGVLTETTADLAWALMMAAARRIVEADRYTREGKFTGWSPTLFLGQDVYGKTLGLIGLGRIGGAVARRAKGFAMNVIYYDVVRFEEKERELGVTFTPLETLLQTSDFISIHTPLTPQTYHLIGEKELKMMKKTAVLVNTARGPIIEENALVKALREKWIFAAGLDVYEKEPALTPGLADLPNVVLVPHIGSASVETRSKMAEIAAKNLILALQGKEPLHRVV